MRTWCSTIIKIRYTRATTFIKKMIVRSIIITATRTGNKTWLAANCKVGNIMGPKQISAYVDRMNAKLATGERGEEVAMETWQQFAYPASNICPTTRSC